MSRLAYLRQGLAAQSKTLSKGALHPAVMANVIGSNPARDVSPIRTKMGPKGAHALTADELRGLRAADEQAPTLTVTGKLVCAAGESLVRVDAKTGPGRRRRLDRVDRSREEHPQQRPHGS